MGKAVLVVCGILIFHTSLAQVFFDRDFQAPPDVAIEKYDSLRYLEVFRKNGTNGIAAGPILRKGRLVRRVEYDKSTRPLNITDFKSPWNADAHCSFTHMADGDVRIEYYTSAGKKYYSWLMRDSVVHECTYHKGRKKQLQAKWEYTYQDDTLLYTLKKYDGWGSLEYQSKNTYSPDNLIIKKEFSRTGLATEFTVYEYDQYRKLTWARSYDSKDSISGIKYNLERDENNEVLSLDVTNDDGKDGKWVYAYDSLGKVVETRIFKSNGRLNRIINYTYDKNGDLIRQSGFNGDRENSRHEYTYDVNGNLVQYESYGIRLGGLNRVYSSISLYDERNKIIRREIFDYLNGLKQRFDYEYTYY